jgi:hypothetical protein
MSGYLIELAKVLVFVSVLFVWVIRYSNIVEEFKFYQYPNWLRDLVGILKISCAVVLMGQDLFLVKTGAIGIMILMLAAMMTHVKVKSPFPKMLPSLTLFLFCSFIFFGSVG